MNSIKILSETELSKGFIKTQAAEIEQTLPNGKTVIYKRSKVEREDAVGIVIYNTSREKFIFVRQYRYPVAQKSDGMLLEIVAGRIENNDDPMQTAIREIREEVGYEVKDIEFLVSYFSAPGYSSEMLHLFFARVSDDDLVANGGGLVEENEYLETEEYTTAEVESMMDTHTFQDGKTILALIYIDRIL